MAGIPVTKVAGAGSAGCAKLSWR